MEKTAKAFMGLLFFLVLTVLPGCGGGGGGGGTPIPAVQPTRALVSIAFDQNVPNLSGIQFKLMNTAGATFDNAAQQVVAINSATDGSLVVANFDATANSNVIALINQASGGIATGTSPFVKVTYAIAADGGQPTFSVDLVSSNTFSAYDSNLQPITSVTATNLVVTVTYDTGP